MDSLRHASPLTPADVLNVLPGMFWDHDCVMLPGLGGFVCNPRSAWYDEAKRQIVPPSRDVLFNSRLTTNDGLVANELMAKHGITYREALKAVEGLVVRIQDDLEKGATVELPGLGKLYGEEDGQLRFMADVEFERMLRSFGHASIPLVARSVGTAAPALAPVADSTSTRTSTTQAAATPEAAPAPILEPAARPETPKEVPTASREPRVIPLRVKLGRAAAAVAIPLTLAGAYLLSEPAGTETLLGTNPLWNAVPVTATYAPLERTSLEAWSETDEAIAGETVQEFVDRTGWEGLLEFDVEAGRPAAGGLRIDVPVTPVTPITPAPTPDPAPDPAPAPTPVAKPAEAPAPVNFLVVGGAFGVKENAEKLSAAMEAEGFETSLHFQAHNGLTVVAMGGYATEEEARRALEDARARGHEKAWLKRL